MVRGLGEKQKKARQITDMKILALLAIEPFTYEGLQKESKIRRETLRRRLDELFARRLILKYKPLAKNKNKDKNSRTNNNGNNDKRYGMLYYLNYYSDKAKKLAIDYHYNNFYATRINNPKKSDELVLEHDRMLTKLKSLEAQIEFKKENMLCGLLSMIESINDRISRQELKERSRLMRELYNQIKPS